VSHIIVSVTLRFRRVEGSILLEVVFATLLVGLLVVPLATAFSGSVHQARDVQERAAADRNSRAEACADAWEWGAMVTDAWWRPGPVLHVRLSQKSNLGSGAAQLGLWVDGCLVAREDITLDGAMRTAPTAPASSGDLQFGPELWAGLADCELVARLRIDDGAWGPPWRLAVPAAGAGAPAWGVANHASAAEDPSVVVHRPSQASSSLMSSWSLADMTSPPFGLLFLLAPAVDGWGGVTLDGRAQSWRMEEARSVDAYY
jgi:hypothetical protein